MAAIIRVRQADGTIVEIPAVAEDAVLYTKQTITEEQQAQARENIGIDSIAEWFDVLVEPIENLAAGEPVSPRQGLDIIRTDDVCGVSITGTCTTQGFLPFAYIPTVNLTVGKTYTVKVESTPAITAKLTKSNDKITTLNANNIVSFDSEVTLEITDDIKAYQYIVVSTLLGPSAVNKQYNLQVRVGAVEGDTFPAWESFYPHDASYPESVADCVSKGELTASVNNTISLRSDASLRYAVATDIHVNNYDSTIELDGDTKTQLLVDAVNAEHHKKPLDFLMITGDIISDGGVAAIQDFKDKFLWQFEMPVVLFPGNHDTLNESAWRDVTGYNRQTTLETDDFYFIFVDVFGDNLGKTWLSHWAARYDSGDTEAYITCDANDDGALLVGADIAVDAVTPTMIGWSNVAKAGNYVKLAKAKDADMYKAPSLDYVKQEVEKAGDKYIILVSHQIMDANTYKDTDTEGVKDYLSTLDNFLFFLEGHAHIYIDSKSSTTGKWTLNSGHFVTPMGGWDKVAANNYMGFRIIEIADNALVTYKVQPTQCVGTPYEHQYNIVNEKTLFAITKKPRADIDLRKISKDKEFAYKLADLETRLSALESQ